MTSDCQKRANRLNAKRSTGPTSEAGKARSARNARKYSFTSPPQLLSGGPKVLSKAARRLLGELTPTEERLALAQMVITAEISLQRAKSERDTFLEEAVDDEELYRIPGYYVDCPFPPIKGPFPLPANAPKSMPIWVVARSEKPATLSEQLVIARKKKAIELRRYERYIRDFRAARRRALKALSRTHEP